MTRRYLPLIGLLAALLVVPAAAVPPKNGDRVLITGIVTDGQGVPLPQMTVSLEVARAGFNLKTLRREKQGTQRVSTTSNDRGEYSIEWLWSDYFNSFDMLVGVQVRRGATEKTEVLQRLDVTARMAGGSPVVAALAVQDTTFLNTLRAFLASLKTDDERRVYAAMGRPDQIDRTEYPEHLEVTWWFFEAGKAYRFRDGKLAEVTPFDPIRQF